ncbi:MAG TPA: hypothetical protein PKV95_00365, partial [Anaerolineaceae bacterium]|nr:hypothetical protein [Anaerolineaceae bacterium]
FYISFRYKTNSQVDGLRNADDQDYLNGSEKKYGPNGFMYYLYDLYNFASSDQGERKVASLNILRKA